MKMTKWILTCALAVSMTAATIRAQKKDAPENTDRHSEELDMLVDLAELDLLADMLESLLREDENAESNPIADFQMPEDGLAGMPGMGIDICGGGFGNLIDRFFRSEGVIDFIDVKFYGLFGLERWPTFNIADSAVVVCGILLLISFATSFKKDSEEKK